MGGSASEVLSNKKALASPINVELLSYLEQRIVIYLNAEQPKAEGPTRSKFMRQKLSTAVIKDLMTATGIGEKRAQPLIDAGLCYNIDQHEIN